MRPWFIRHSLSLCWAIGAAFFVLSIDAFAFGPAKPAGVVPDPVTESTVLDGDATGLIDCAAGHVQAGFCYMRAIEGDAANQSIWFIGPPAKCAPEREACVFVKVYNAQGQVAWGGSIPKGQTRVEAPWKALLGSDTFERGYRGLWSVNHEVYWLDSDGRERRSVSQTDLVLRVYRKGYVPLDKVAADPAFVWSWAEAGFLYRVTSGLRAYVARAR